MNEHDIIQVDGFDAVVIDGIPRKLNKLPPDPIRRALMPPFTQTGVPMVDDSQWYELNRRTEFGDNFILDQKSHGSCVGFSSAGALMRALVLAGHPPVRLSGSYTYSWINDGYDDGAVISDSLGSLIAHGTCLESTVGWDSIYRNSAKAGDVEAKRFRILEAYKVGNFNELASGILLGFIGVGAVMVGNTFTRLDAHGVAGFDAGPGNHAVCLDGVHCLPSGEWVVDLPNSWGLAFGQRGRCFVTKRHIESVDQDCYLIRAAQLDPQDPNTPPVVVV